MRALKVYLAAPFQMKDEIKARVELLRSFGIEVTSTWVDEPHKASIQLKDLSPETHLKYATADVQDIVAADMLILQDDPTIVRAGRHVEFGVAIGLGLTRPYPIFVVGPIRANIFHYLSQVYHFETWEEIVQRLQTLAKIGVQE